MPSSHQWQSESQESHIVLQPGETRWGKEVGGGIGKEDKRMRWEGGRREVGRERGYYTTRYKVVAVNAILWTKLLRLLPGALQWALQPLWLLPSYQPAAEEGEAEWSTLKVSWWKQHPARIQSSSQMLLATNWAGKSIWPKFRRPRSESWLDLNAFFSPSFNSANKTLFNT